MRCSRIWLGLAVLVTATSSAVAQVKPNEPYEGEIAKKHNNGGYEDTVTINLKGKLPASFMVSVVDPGGRVVKIHFYDDEGVQLFQTEARNATTMHKLKAIPATGSYKILIWSNFKGSYTLEVENK